MASDEALPESAGDPIDRDAVLARRRRFLARALDGIGERAKTGAKLAAVTAGSVGAACGIFQPCLNYDITESEESDSDDETETGGETGETGGETGETGETGAETGETGAETGETGGTG